MVSFLYLPRPDACETCKLRVEELAVIMTEEEMVVNMTSQVQGELFCDMEGAWWDVEGCKVELVRQYCDCNLYCIY